MDVNGAGAPEVVVAPDLLQQLLAGEHPARVLRQVLQQFELLVREVKDLATHRRGVAGLIDQQLAVADLGLRTVLASHQTAHRQPEPGLHLGRPSTVEDDVIDPPVRCHRG